MYNPDRTVAIHRLRITLPVLQIETKRVKANDTDYCFAYPNHGFSEHIFKNSAVFPTFTL